MPCEQWLTVAYLRDGERLTTVSLNAASGKIEGEGPYRLAVPPLPPGDRPDRGSKHSPSGFGDGWDYDGTRDHNAGAMVRGLVAIRVNPLPRGCEEPDFAGGGWRLAGNGQIAVYGFGISSSDSRSSRRGKDQ
jgi:hypothetical protein